MEEADSVATRCRMQEASLEVGMAEPALLPGKNSLIPKDRVIPSRKKNVQFMERGNADLIHTLLKRGQLLLFGLRRRGMLQNAQVFLLYLSPFAGKTSFEKSDDFFNDGLTAPFLHKRHQRFVPGKTIFSGVRTVCQTTK